MSKLKYIMVAIIILSLFFAVKGLVYAQANAPVQPDVNPTENKTNDADKITGAPADVKNVQIVTDKKNPPDKPSETKKQNNTDNKKTDKTTPKVKGIPKPKINNDSLNDKKIIEPVKPSEPQKTIIDSIIIQGNLNIPAKDILNVITSKIGDPMLEPKIRRDQQSIYDMGYFSDVKVDISGTREGVVVTFRVLENPVVKEIEITGNKIVPTDKLLSLIDTKVGQVLNSKSVYADVMEINNYYNEQLGYIYNNHVPDVDWDKNGKLIFKVIDGLIVKQIVIKGNTVYTYDTLMSLVSIKPDQLLNKNDLTKDVNKIEKYYKDNDYLISMQQPAIDFKTGVVTINVSEAIVDEILFDGNTKTKTSFLKKIVKIKPGEVLRSKRIKRDFERLQSLQIFESIEPIIEPSGKPEKVNIIWKVKEQKTGMALFGLGYGGGVGATSNAGLVGSISYMERNLSGQGRTPSIQWQRGSNIDSGSISYYDPSINLRSDSFGFSLYRSHYNELKQPVYDTNPVQYANYNDYRKGASITFGRFFTDDLRGLISFRRDQLNLFQSADSAYTPIGMMQGNLNGVIVSGIYDTRDDVFDPYIGEFATGAVSVNGGPLKGSFTFNKYQLEIRKYIGFMKDNVIALRGWFGADQGNVPATEYFYIGGTDTLRAFQDNQFFGTKLVLFNAEYRFPLLKIKYLKGCVFADAGNAWSAGQPFVIYKDVGAGLRLVFPKFGLGVIRLDYAYSSQYNSRFSIGIGPSF